METKRMDSVNLYGTLLEILVNRNIEISKNGNSMFSQKYVFNGSSRGTFGGQLRDFVQHLREKGHNTIFDVKLEDIHPRIVIRYSSIY